MLNEGEIKTVNSLLAIRDAKVSLEDLDAMEATLKKHLKVKERTRGAGTDFEIAKAVEPLVERLLEKLNRNRSKRNAPF